MRVLGIAVMLVPGAATPTFAVEAKDVSVTEEVVAILEN